MTATARLALVLHRRASPSDRRHQMLAVGAAAISAVMFLLLVGLHQAAQERAGRTAWLTPTPSQHPTAVQALDTTFFRGDPISVVHLAQLPGRPAAPPPPGLATFPAPGQAFASPALAELLADQPASQLADRFGGAALSGQIAAAGLAAPDQLVMVIGVESTDPFLSPEVAAAPMANGLSGRAEVAGFVGSTALPYTASDQTSTLLIGGLLVVPVLVLAAAAGRLGAARRQRRLAVLRLAGASPRQVMVLTGLETAAVATVGAVAGTALYAAALPALAMVPLGWSVWFPGQLWPGFLPVLAVIAGTVLITTVSSLLTLWPVIRAPYAAAQRSHPQRTSLIRLGIFLVLLGYVAYTGAQGDLSTAAQLSLVIVVYLAFWFVGPWVTDVLGRLLSRCARRPATLLAGRRLSDDPRSTWRTISGLVMAGLVAGLFTLTNLSGIVAAVPAGAVAVPAGPGTDLAALAGEARESLTSAGVPGQVQVSDGRSDGGDGGVLLGSPGIEIAVAADPAQIDTAITLAGRLGQAGPVLSAGHLTYIDEIAIRELRDAGLAALVLGFIVAATSAGITAAAAILDRRRVMRRLHLAGVPLRLLDRARQRETVIPLVVLAGGTTAAGAYGASLLNDSAGTTVQVTNLVQLGVCLLLGGTLMLGAIAASGPLLRRIATSPAIDDE